MMAFQALDAAVKATACDTEGRKELALDHYKQAISLYLELSKGKLSLIIRSSANL